MSVKSKLAIPFLAILITAVGVISVLDVDHSLHLMYAELMTAGNRTGKQIFEQMRVAVEGNPHDPATALQTSSGLRAAIRSARAFDELTVFVAIVGADQHLLAGAQETESGLTEGDVVPIEQLTARANSKMPLALLSPLWSDHTYLFKMPVAVGGQPFGTIDVGISTGLLAPKVRRLVVTVTGIALGVLAVALIVLLVTGNFILRPLLALSTGMEQLASDENAGEVKLDVAGDDELGNLAEKFNQLSHRVRSDRLRWENERGHLVNAFRSITDAVVLLDREGYVLFANNEAHDRLGMSEATIEGKPLRSLLGTEHPLVRMIDPALGAGTETHDTVLELPPLAGESGGRRFLLSLFPLGQGRETAGQLAIMRDLAQVRELENVVDYSNRLVRLGGLLSGVAHQLRKPLHAMTLKLELLKQNAIAGKDVEVRVEQLRSEIRRLDVTIEALMRFMKPEKLKESPVAINSLLRELGASIANDRNAIDYDLDQRLPMVTGDLALLREALLNLIQNGVEAMPDGGRLRLASRLLEDGTVEISVADKGPGIPAEIKDNIFNLYFTTKSHGNGLGLSVAARAVDLHGGAIRVDSEPGQGTTFVVRLPVGNRAAASAEAHPALD